MIASVCRTWRVDWGPGSPRPSQYMLYRHCGSSDEYMGTYLTLSGAVRAAVSIASGPLEWGRSRRGRRPRDLLEHVEAKSEARDRRWL